MSSLKQVTLITDGACSGNPGPGGYGTILQYGEKEKEFSGSYRQTTNNRMEMLAVIIGFESLNQGCEVHVISDSKYIIDAITKNWLAGWKRKGWTTSGKKPVKNIDLWKRMEQAMDRHQLTWEWVRGHDGHELNERADELAVVARENEEAWQVDEEFERLQT